LKIDYNVPRKFFLQRLTNIKYTKSQLLLLIFAFEFQILMKIANYFVTHAYRLIYIVSTGNHFSFACDILSSNSNLTHTLQQ